MTYSTITDHRAMVFDGIRNASYIRALEKVITPDTTVMDLGAGLGILGLSAATLGAAAVHLVDPSPVLAVARTVAAENSLQNIHCHPCRAEELQLEERVDVLVSVFTGNFLLTEDLLPALFRARDRFLAPNGKMIPDRARMEVVPVTAPDYYRKYIDAWRDYPKHARKHGEPALDYQAVRSFAANTLYYDTRERFNASQLAAPTALAELDFTTATSASCDGRVEVEISRDGTCHGWLGWFQIYLLDEWLSTSGEPEATHWKPVFLPLDQPLPVAAGERIRFALKRPEYGEWTWTTTYAGQRQRQSTFLSQPVTPARLLGASEIYRPRLSESGSAVQWVLARMTGETPVGELAAGVYERFPAVFTSDADAVQFVQGLAERYS